MRPIVTVANVDILSDENLFSKAYDKMPPMRREKIDRYRMKTDKRLSLGAGVLLEYGLKKHGYDLRDVKLSENGKPYIENDPVYFSISHSKNVAAVAISPVNVGVDVEYIDNIDLKIAERFFTKEEYNEIKSSENPDRTFFRIWTLKESLLKLTGTGMKTSLNSFRIILGDKTGTDLNRPKKKYYFKEFDDIENFGLSVALEKYFRKIDFEIIDLSKIIKEEI